ncbi:hypothetical protein DYB25_012751 [Aphanomyces astaci]|uniref:Uncharacterized protein n=1 Tax=Aphanomyces astaci TaxID=112090 RepID=A0A397ACJ2_APHAT|nr:hypothetical protein DYB25_012751 [Aphanomyces astaci]RHY69340.1 hypothetical protein DYB30_012251 [Aphanomyces astaci]RQM28275.1 hypothetical protein B5M09_007827 [Aphanomyces astaci]
MDALLASELSAETLAALQAHLAATQIADESADDEVSEDFRLSQLYEAYASSFSSEKPLCLTFVLVIAALKEAMADELGLTPSGFVPTFESKLSNRLTTYVNYSSERFGKYEA